MLWPGLTVTMRSLVSYVKQVWDCHVYSFDPIHVLNFITWGHACNVNYTYLWHMYCDICMDNTYKYKNKCLCTYTYRSACMYRCHIICLCHFKYMHTHCYMWHTCVLCVLCLAGLFSSIRGPHWRYITASISQAWPSMTLVDHLPGQHATAQSARAPYCGK